MTQIDVVELRDPVLMLRARGRINTVTAEVFEADARNSIGDTGSHVLIEASEVTYLSTAGLRVFLRLWNELKQRGRLLLLCSFKPYINEVFELLGFHKVMDIFSDMDSALAFAGAGASKN